MIEKGERLAEFMRRLAALPPAVDAAEAREQLERILNEVENELTAIPSDPTEWQSDGRMYPPQDDAMRMTANALVVRFRSRAHDTFIGANGAIKICRRPVLVVFSKAGADGRTVDDL